MGSPGGHPGFLQPGLVRLAQWEKATAAKSEDLVLTCEDHTVGETGRLSSDLCTSAVTQTAPHPLNKQNVILQKPLSPLSPWEITTHSASMTSVGTLCKGDHDIFVLWCAASLTQRGSLGVYPCP